MKEKIWSILEQVLKIKVDDETSQYNCSEWDSLHHLMLIIELENEFNLSLEPEDISIIKSVGDIEKILNEKLSKTK